MPVTINEIFNKIGLTPSLPVKWGEKIHNKNGGIYIISSSSDPSKNIGIQSSCEVNELIFNRWKDFSKKLTTEENVCVSKQTIELEINKFWKPQENILYIGESSLGIEGLGKRIKQFYDHKVGQNGPHTGGYWIKLLSQLENLFIYHANCKHARDVEFKMLMYFIEQTTGKSFYELEGLGKYLPFANLKVDFQKSHSIKFAVSKKTSKS